MPKRDSSRAVTRVSSHKMRSALRNTHSARNVRSPRLPIGVATRCRPGASSCSGAHSAPLVAESLKDSSGNDRLALVPRDTTGTPDGAAGAARAALADGAQLILGPLLAAEVDAVKPVAGEAKINVIAFSTATQLAGDNVFLMGFLPRQEVVREAAFARESGLSRFAVLAPNSEYGRLMTDALRETAGQAGATVVKAATFDPR